MFIRAANQHRNFSLSASIENHAELVWRLGLPISTVLLALLCLSISFEHVRGGKSYAIGVGALLFIIYKNVLAFVETQVAQGSIVPWQGYVIPHLSMLVISSLLLLWRSGSLSALCSKLVVSDDLTRTINLQRGFKEHCVCSFGAHFYFCSI